MNKEERFSKVSRAYFTNLALLNEAKNEFHRELGEFQELVRKHVRELRNAKTSRIAKVSFRTISDDSTRREGPWTTHVSRTCMDIHLKPHNYRRFMYAGRLFFEIRYIAADSKFVFQARIENASGSRRKKAKKIITDIDKHVSGLVSAKGQGSFPGTNQDGNILFRADLDDIHRLCRERVKAVLDVCVEAVDCMYPDSAYGGSVE